MMFFSLFVTVSKKKQFKSLLNSAALNFYNFGKAKNARDFFSHYPVRG